MQYCIYEKNVILYRPSLHFPCGHDIEYRVDLHSRVCIKIGSLRNPKDNSSLLTTRATTQYAEM